MTRGEAWGREGVRNRSQLGAVGDIQRFLVFFFLGRRPEGK